MLYMSVFISGLFIGSGITQIKMILKKRKRLKKIENIVLQETAKTAYKSYFSKNYESYPKKDYEIDYFKTKGFEDWFKKDDE